MDGVNDVNNIFCIEMNNNDDLTFLYSWNWVVNGVKYMSSNFYTVTRQFPSIILEEKLFQLK